MLKERRRHERHTINRVAKIQSAGSLARDCLVTDISESGARLYAEGIVIPDEFVLLLTGVKTMRRECRVVWRLGNEIGVEFA
jgi:PilZ domain